MNNSLEENLRWIDEHHNGTRYGLEGKVLIDERSSYQRITIIESSRYGKGLLLDGCWMTTERQEKSYHECLVQPALCSADSIKKILIIGGGDGGTARECLRHQEVESLDMVEIDGRVIELSQRYLPTIGKEAWKDDRLRIKIEDGIKWVENSQNNIYDVVIVDGSDPLGPAKGLFNSSFLKNCKRILKPKGIFATQSESPESFTKVHIDMVKTIRKVFEFADPLYGWVPIYPSGWWSWTFASTGKAYYLNPLPKRAVKIEKDCKIWNTRWHKGGFQTMPNFIEELLKNE